MRSKIQFSLLLSLAVAQTVVGQTVDPRTESLREESTSALDKLGASVQVLSAETKEKAILKNNLSPKRVDESAIAAALQKVSDAQADLNIKKANKGKVGDIKNAQAALLQAQLAAAVIMNPLKPSTIAASSVVPTQPVTAPAVVTPPVAAPPTPQSETERISVAMTNARKDYVAAFTTVEKYCWRSAQKQIRSVSDAQHREDTVNMTGSFFAGAAGVSTVHTVSSGLAAIAVWLTSGNKNMAGYLGDNVASATSNFTAYQNAIAKARAQFDADINAAWAMDDGPWGPKAMAQLIQALQKLEMSCDEIGVTGVTQAAAPTTPVAPAPVAPAVLSH